MLNSNPAVPEEYARVKDTEVLRAPMTRGTAGEPAERFLIGLAPARAAAASMTLAWGDQTWAIDIRPASPSASSR